MDRDPIVRTDELGREFLQWKCDLCGKWSDAKIDVAYRDHIWGRNGVQGPNKVCNECVDDKVSQFTHKEMLKRRKHLARVIAYEKAKKEAEVE